MEVNDTESSGTPAAGSRPVTPERRAEALREANSGSRPLAFLWEWTKIFWISVALFLVIRTFFVEAFHIPTGSMENTLLPGDFLLVNKLAYGAEVPFTHDRLPALEHPKFGDVIVFDYPKDPAENFVKRLVGLPGDTLQMRNGVLIRDGKVQHEKYVRHDDPGFDPSGAEFDWQRRYLVNPAAAPDYHPSQDNWGPLVVPPKHYFVLGDNRDNSLDSRYWGFVPDSLVTGRPILIYYSYAPDSSDQALAWITHVRWRRLGELVH